MAHQISHISGRPEVFTAGLPPWHCLGTNVPERVTSAEGIQLAGLDWSVEQVPVLGDLAPGSKFRDTFKIEDKVANIRRDAMGQPVYLGTVGRGFRPIQNTEAFEFMDALIGQGQAVYETAGAIRDGRRVWMLVRLPEDLTVGSEDDRIQRYLLLVNGHDGGQALKVFWTPVRVVCANTLNAALRGSEQGISIRHTERYKDRLEEARKVLGMAQRHYGDLGEVLNLFFHEAMTERQAEGYFEGIFPGVSQPIRTTRTENIHTRLMDNFLAGDQGAESARGTLFGAYNAITRYVDHGRSYGGDAERRFGSVLFGQGRILKQKAFDLARGLIAARN